MRKTSYQWLPGPVGDCLKPSNYATTATLPVSPSTTLVYTTGHIGLDLETCALINDTTENEFQAIFNCLDAALKHAGAADGCAAAHKFVSYITEASFESIMQEVFKKRWPRHTPTWTTVVVSSMNVDGAHAEIAAEAAIYHS